MNGSSLIELSTSAYRDNLTFIKSVLGDQARFSSVVKGNAYGHGLETFLPLALGAGVDHFSVFSQDEAYLAKKIIEENASIMVMGFMDEDGIAWAIENNVEFYGFNFERLLKVIDVSFRLGKKAMIHLEVETGMNRTGFKRDQRSKLIAAIKENIHCFSLCGLCTHFAGAESISNFPRIKKQLSAFETWKAFFEKQEVHFKNYHSACSAAALRLPSSRMDRARVGILQFGFWPSREIYIERVSRKIQNADPLKSILTWKSKVMDVHFVKMGEYVEYGNSFIASRDSVIAIIPVGYSLGYSRSLSNHGRVLIRGIRVNVVGVVNMNLVAADVTDLPSCEVGDEVVLIGKQGDNEITVSSFSELSEMVNYELLTRLPHSIQRKIVE